ncbi:unnamed protein product [Mytilus coruscus]|uniref:Reverse transcriptase domain-containing protein n=1 Tax=Mytilus coruscus TaxID=42192 RepID=A0A6J8AG07_MYTCO|nr:unnamed protein product [Mytilus coruscus]
MYETSKTAQVIKEMQHYRLDILGNRKRLDKARLKSPNVKKAFCLDLKNRLSVLDNSDDREDSIQEKWDNIKDMLQDQLQVTYRTKDKEVKRSARKDKRQYLEDLAKEAEKAAILTEREQAKRWVLHFKEVLNCPEPDVIANPEPSEDDVNINKEPPTIEEVRNAIKSLKTGKAPGIDSIHAKMLKADLDASSKVLYNLFLVIWKEGDIPSDWSKDLIVKLPKNGNLRNFDNLRGITLLSVPSKVF